MHHDISVRQDDGGEKVTYRNSEGYKDPTAGKAIISADRPPKQVTQVIHILKLIASLAGFDIIGRIRLRDRETGREW